MTLTKAISCIELSSYQHSKAVDKRVRWSIELEEVYYYKPTKNTASKIIGKKFKKVKRKASVLAEQVATGFTNIQSEFTSKILKNRSSYDISYCESDMDNSWDKLFELYGAL